MQLVVPSAVSAAVSAAIAMRITTSQKFFFISFSFNINCHQCPEIIKNIIYEKFMFNSWSFVFLFL